MLEKISDKLAPDNLNASMFHYTNADGLFGILSKGEIWSTAPFATNDKSELNAVKGILTNIFAEQRDQMITDDHEYITLFQKNGINFFQYPKELETAIFNAFNKILGIYVTSFCTAENRNVFENGLLSQWRGYGRNGGYTLQFSRSKFNNFINLSNENSENCAYALTDVNYNLENPFKDAVLNHKESFIEMYVLFMDLIASVIRKVKQDDKLIDQDTVNQFVDSKKESIKSLFLYALLTKDSNFSEERECRLTAFLKDGTKDDVKFFNRNDVLVPYIKTPGRFSENLLDSIERIIVGPGPYQDVRHQSVEYLLKFLGLEKEVRSSEIPYTGSHMIGMKLY